jgi:DNA-directed RNA polymerase beta' subunit
MTRKLTPKEIENILDFIKPRSGIPQETAYSIMKINKIPLRKQLKNISIYPELIPELKKQIEEYYNNTIIQPGESVGIMCAQSIGEKQTQMTLNTFHKAGQSEKGVTAGVPRFQELINATHKLNAKSLSCKIYFKENNKNIKELRNYIGHSIVELTFKKISKSINVYMNKNDEPWYDTFIKLYDKENKFDRNIYKNCITIKLDMNILFEYKLTMKEISSFIDNKYFDMFCIYSPPDFGQLDIYVDTTNIELPEKRLVFIDSDNAKEIYLQECVQPILEKLIISGIEGIKHIYYTNENNEWIIETEGSNFEELLLHPNIDHDRTISNNVWEIYETLGIEAAKQFLIEEFMVIMEGINDCHPRLLVEKMTFSGTISSISRYTMRKEEAGPMGKASFEETMDNFIKAASCGDIEPTNGVSASIICGKLAPIGSGMVDLAIDIKNLPSFFSEFNNKEQNFIDENQQIIKKPIADPSTFIPKKLKNKK